MQKRVCAQGGVYLFERRGNCNEVLANEFINIDKVPLKGGAKDPYFYEQLL
jgi:hypothetical protein